MVETSSFGYGVQRRRKALDPTREELARRVGCATETIKNIERDEQGPLCQIAKLLANVLTVRLKNKRFFYKLPGGSVGRLSLVL